MGKLGSTWEDLGVMRGLPKKYLGVSKLGSTWEYLGVMRGNWHRGQEAVRCTQATLLLLLSNMLLCLLRWKYIHFKKNNIAQYVRRQVREGKFCTPSKRGNPVYSTSASQHCWEGIYVNALLRRICLLNLLRRICMSALLRRRHQVSPKSRFSTTLGIHSLPV